MTPDGLHIAAEQVVLHKDCEAPAPWLLRTSFCVASPWVDLLRPFGQRFGNNRHLDTGAEVGGIVEVGVKN